MNLSFNLLPLGRFRPFFSGFSPFLGLLRGQDRCEDAHLWIVQGLQKTSGPIRKFEEQSAPAFATVNANDRFSYDLILHLTKPMSEHDDLLEYRRDSDFPAYTRFVQTAKDGQAIAGFRCPYCFEYYAPEGSRGGSNPNSELLAARMKQAMHSRSCRVYLKILLHRKKEATDPVYAREMEIKFLLETGRDAEIPPDWAEDVKKFWKKYERQ